MVSPIYAIGDIHGQFNMLQHALKCIEDDGGADAQVVFLGDYIDRGPDSSKVLELLIQAQKNGRPWVALKGNHDAYLEGFLETGELYSSRTRPDLSWLDPVLGGQTTLQSYGVKTEGLSPQAIREQAREKVPSEHLEFLKSLPLSYDTGDHLFVHAGIRPGVELAEQDPQDLMWIRKEFLNDTRDHGRLVVHGHSAVTYPENHGNRVNLDGGAGRGRPLYPAVFEGRDVFLLTDFGREELPLQSGKA